MAEHPGHTSRAGAPSLGVLERIEGAVNETREIVRGLARPGGTDASERVEELSDAMRQLEARLEAAETDGREIAEQLVALEHRNNRLLNLYVATYQLYSSLDPAEVRASICDVATTLLGAECFAILERTKDGGYEVTVRQGVDESATTNLGRASSDGGDPMVDACLRGGVVELDPTGAEGVLAAVPFSVQGEVTGALVIFRMLEHKHSLGEDDRELLDLLAAHAASALLAADICSVTSRKLRTFENLVDLVRRPRTAPEAT